MSGQINEMAKNLTMQVRSVGWFGDFTVLKMVKPARLLSKFHADLIKNMRWTVV